MKLSKALASLVCLAATATAHAVVISDTQIRLSGTNSDYSITAIQSASYDDPTTMWFTKSDTSTSSTLTPNSWNIDQEADYYLVKAGDTFTTEAIAAGKFTPLFTTDHPFTLAVPYPGTFYLGVATGYSYTSRDVLGWAKIRNDASGLTLLGSAMSYGEGGIIVGTTTAVPEPGRAMLMLLGLSSLAFARRQRRPANKHHI